MKEIHTFKLKIQLKTKIKTNRFQNQLPFCIMTYNFQFFCHAECWVLTVLTGCLIKVFLRNTEVISSKISVTYFYLY